MELERKFAVAVTVGNLREPTAKQPQLTRAPKGREAKQARLQTIMFCATLFGNGGPGEYEIELTAIRYSEEWRGTSF